MSLLLLLPIEWFALIAMLLLCGHVATGLCIRTDVRPVCPVGLHVEGVLVICSRGTRVLLTTSVSHPFERPGNLRVLDLSGNFSAVLRRNYVELY
jgi:hypothetical protein